MPSTRLSARRRAPDPIVAATVLLLLAMPVWITVKLQGPVNGPDSLWHLALGRALRQTWDFGPRDPLSYLTTQPWVYNQWVPEVVASAAEDLGGLPAVAWLMDAGRLAIIVLLWSVCRRRATALPALAAAMVGSFGTAGAWDARPQLVGIALFVVAADACLRTVDDGRPRWWLIPLTWVWAMCHGTWTLGVLLGLMVAASAVVDRPSDGVRRHLARFAVPVLAAAAAAATPVGPRLYMALGSINDVSEFIQEWQAASLRTPSMAVTMVGAVVIIIAWARGWVPRPNWGRIVVWCFALGCALMYARTIAVGALMLAPLLAETLQAVLPRRGRHLRLEAASLAAGIVLALGYGAATLPTVARLPGDAPTGLSADLAALPPSVVFGDQGVGGWLHWAHPQLTPVFDTRSEVYGRAAVVSYLETYALKRGWQSRFDATGATYALLLGDAPLAAALVEQRGWRLIGEDRGFVLLARA